MPASAYSVPAHVVIVELICTPIRTLSVMLGCVPGRTNGRCVPAMSPLR